MVLRRLGTVIADIARRNPHAASIEPLQLGSMSASRPLMLEVAEHFEAFLVENPDDAVAPHHLAIIYHGLACHSASLLDRELSAEAEMHWKRGLSAWSRIAKDDAFWMFLRQRWQSFRQMNPNDRLVERLVDLDLATLRRKLPELLIDAHLKLVQDVFEHDRARAVRLYSALHSAGFDPALLSEPLRRMYQDVTKRFQELCKAPTFAEAEAVIERFLEFMPYYEVALRDRLISGTGHADWLRASNEPLSRVLGVLTRLERWIQRAQSQMQSKANRTLRDLVVRYYVVWIRALLASTHDASAPASARLDWLKQARQMCLVATQYDAKSHDLRQLVVAVLNRAVMVNSERARRDMFDLFPFVEAVEQLDPTSPHGPAVKALCYLREGNTAQVRRELQRAERLNESMQDEDIGSLITDLRSVLG